MKTYIIQLESHDDVISARDKMAWSKAPRILLVWPRKGRILDRPADLFILQRHAQTLGAQLGVVSGDGDVRAAAAELGIPNFLSAVQAQRGSWRRPRGKRRINWRKFREGKTSLDLREHPRANPRSTARKYPTPPVGVRGGHAGCVGDGHVFPALRPGQSIAGAQRTALDPACLGQPGY